MSKLSSFLKGIERKVSSVIPHQHSSDLRQQRYAMKEQMDLYREQKETLAKQNAELSKQKDYERQRLHEKQIRALRGTYRKSRGFLGSDTSGASSSAEPNQTLG